MTQRDAEPAAPEQTGSDGSGGARSSYRHRFPHFNLDTEALRAPGPAGGVVNATLNLSFLPPHAHSKTHKGGK